MFILTASNSLTQTSLQAFLPTELDAIKLLDLDRFIWTLILTMSKLHLRFLYIG